MISRKTVPPTALLAEYDQPYLAAGIEEFWGKRWHHKVRRHLTRISSLFPYGRTKLGNTLGAYLVSVMLHSFLMARGHPEPTIRHPTSFLPLFLDRGTLLFFGSQGVCMQIERRLIPQPWKRVWLWVTIIWSGRYYIDAVMKHYAR